MNCEPQRKVICPQLILNRGKTSAILLQLRIALVDLIHLDHVGFSFLRNQSTCVPKYFSSLLLLKKKKSGLLFLLDNDFQWKQGNLLLKTELLLFLQLYLSLNKQSKGKQKKLQVILEYSWKLLYVKLIWLVDKAGQSLLHLPYRFNGIITVKLQKASTH